MQHHHGHTVFFDIDGVLGDFDRHLDAHGLRDANGQPRWSALSAAWWWSMPEIAGARDFFRRVAAVVPTRFLTAPVLSAECFTGKAIWVQAFLSHEGKAALKRLIIAPGTDKAYLAGPGRILIDDRQKNIDQWVAAGGIGIVFSGDFAAVERQLEAALGRPIPGPAAVPARRSFVPRGPR